MSTALNALACTFVFAANTNLYCFYSAFREARRLRESVEQAMILAIFSYLLVNGVLFMDLFLGLNSIIIEAEALYILYLMTPILSFACLSRPTKNSVMKR